LVKPVWVLHRRGLWLAARYCPGRFPVRPGGARLVCRPGWSRPAANSGGTASLRPSARPAQRYHCARGSIGCPPMRPARHAWITLSCRCGYRVVSRALCHRGRGWHSGDPVSERKPPAFHVEPGQAHRPGAWGRCGPWQHRAHNSEWAGHESLGSASTEPQGPLRVDALACEGGDAR